MVRRKPPGNALCVGFGDNNSSPDGLVASGFEVARRPLMKIDDNIYFDKSDDVGEQMFFHSIR